MSHLYDVSYDDARGLRNYVVLITKDSIHTLDMSDEIKRRRATFVKWLADRGLTVADIKRDTGIPKTTIYSYLGGKSDSLKGTTQDRIAEHYGVTADTLFGRASSQRKEVGVWGKIGAGAEVYPLTDYASVPMYEITLPATLDPDQEYVAFEIEGFSMPPAEPGWIAVFRKVEVRPEDLIGFPCLVDTLDGRRLFKRLRRGYEPGHYNLESWDGSPLLENVQITAVLPFAVLSPGRQGR